jgi:hypothetical protein
MDLNGFISQMTSNAQRIRALVEGVSDEQACWKPDSVSWSILEVVNHLYDEEREDFRVRLDFTLHRPGQPWPGIDPEGWVTERAYNQRGLEESLRNFLAAREESLGWLRNLAEPDWEAGYEAPFGRIRAGDLLVSWVGHDLMHMRQLVELQWAYLVDQVEPYGVRYAGVW